MPSYKLSILKLDSKSGYHFKNNLLKAIREDWWDNFPKGLASFTIDQQALLSKLPQGSNIHEKEAACGEESQKASWLNISVPWRQAGEAVKICLDEIIKDKLCLVDWQNNEKLWSWNEFAYAAPCECSERANQFLASLQKADLHICNSLLVEERSNRRNNGNRKSYRAYSLVISSRKRHGLAMEERVKRIYALLQTELRKDEKLECRNKSFIIDADAYQIAFVVEGYNKNPSITAYMEEGKPVVKPLRRMNSKMAMRRARKLYGGTLKNSPVWRRLGLLDMVNRFPNPADRFVASVKIEEKLRYINMGIGYDSYGRSFSGSIWLYNISHDQDSCTNMKNMDYLYIGEEAFTFIYPFIVKYAGDDFDYSSRINTFHCSIINKIVYDMRELSFRILYYPYTDEVKNYLAKMDIRYIDGDSNKYNNTSCLAYKNRKRLFEFYNFICDWLENNMVYGERVINIAGV